MGVDPDVFSTRPFRQAPEPFEIICVGRLAPVKAQRMLISAIAILAREGRRVLLHVVGGGPDRASLERYVEHLGIGKVVVFHGFTPQDKLDEIYRQSDVFALASFAEGLPGVLMEAMAMEIPCVATWITGVPELIRDGIDGLLVPPADPSAMATAISRLMDDPELRRNIGVAGRKRILEKFHLRKNAGHLAGIFGRRTSLQRAPALVEKSGSPA
jgi:glycosyltransferase involved in cell wall biosynthesis